MVCGRERKSGEREAKMPAPCTGRQFLISQHFIFCQSKVRSLGAIEVNKSGMIRVLSNLSLLSCSLLSHCFLVAHHSTSGVTRDGVTRDGVWTHVSECLFTWCLNTKMDDHSPESSSNHHILA